MKYIVYELIEIMDDTILREIDGTSRFDDEKHAIDGINEVREAWWQEFTILKVYQGE